MTADQRVLTLYTRAGCLLCVEAKLELLRLGRRAGFSIVEVDVDADPALEARFGLDVPVIFAGEREVCRHRVDRAAVRAALR